MSGSTGAVPGCWTKGEEAASQPESNSSVGTAYRDWPLMSLLELGALPTAPACARLHTRNVLAEWQLPRELIADAETVASELMTNAYKATVAFDEIAPMALRLLANRTQVVVEAWDCHPGIPVHRPYSLEQEGGRGLAVIEALSARWGFQRVSKRQKVVWAELLIRETSA